MQQGTSVRGRIAGWVIGVLAATVLVLGLTPHGAWAASADAVSMDCAGDSLTGAIRLDGVKGVARVDLVGSTGSEIVLLDRQTVRLTGTALAENFAFALDRHLDAYQARVRVGDARYDSAPVTDDTCQPPAQVDESPSPLLVPLAMAAAFVAVWSRSKRRRGTLA